MSNKLYHGSSQHIEGALKPILKHGTLDHVHDRPAVFATERIDVASLFMFPADILASIGFEQDIAYICIWGTPEEFTDKDKGGFVYVLPSISFEKMGKDYEWQSFEAVEPLEIREFGSVIGGMVECGAQVYFIDSDDIFDRITADKNNRVPILKKLISENQKINSNLKTFK